jgi:hypothetical protein
LGILLPEESPALFGPDTLTLRESVRLIWRHRPASSKLGSQRIGIWRHRRCGRDLILVAQLDGAGRDNQNHCASACET